MKGVVHFCASMGQQVESDKSSGDTSNRRKFLRAALAEYASLDEAATIDASEARIVAPRIFDLDDPRLHVVKLLRHANVHLSVSQVKQTFREATWRGQDFNFQIFYSPDIRTSIQKTREVTKYQDSDLSKMFEWIETEQMEWGLDHLIFKTAELYAENLLSLGVPADLSR